MNNYIQLIAGVLLVLSQPGTLLAAQSDSQATSSGHSVTEKVFNTSHNAVSRSIVNLADKIDQFFGSSRYQAENNGTELRVGSLSSLNKQGILRHSIQTQFYLDLPATNKRFQIVLKSDQGNPESNASDPGFIDDIADSSEAEQLADNDVVLSERNLFSAALQMIISSNEKWDIRSSAGLQFNIPSIEPVAEFRIRRNINLGHSNLRLTEALKWTATQNFRNDIKMELEKSLTAKYFARFTSAYTLSQLDPHQKILEDISLIYTKDQRKAFVYSTGVHQTFEPLSAPHFFYINGRFRHMVYKNWVFYEFLTYVNAPSEDNYRLRPGLQFSIDLIFNQHI